MIKQFDIHISPESYEKKDGRFGNIHIQLDEYAFPGEGWTDFGSDIIYWWMEAFIKLFTRAEKKVRCSFMDGNYRFDLEATEDKRVWRIYLIREYADSEEIKMEGEVAPKQITEAIAQVAKAFEKLDRNKGDEKSANNYNHRIMLLLSAMQNNLAEATQ